MRAHEELGDQHLMPELTSRFRYLNPCIELAVVASNDRVVAVGTRRCRTTLPMRMEAVIIDTLFWQEWWRKGRERLGLPSTPLIPDSLADSYEVLASPFYRLRFGTYCGLPSLLQLGYPATHQLVDAQAVDLLNDLLVSPAVVSRLYAISGLEALRFRGVDVGSYVDSAIVELVALDSAIGRIQGCSGCTVQYGTARSLLVPNTTLPRTVVPIPYGQMTMILNDTLVGTSHDSFFLFPPRQR